MCLASSSRVPLQIQLVSILLGCGAPHAFRPSKVHQGETARNLLGLVKGNLFGLVDIDVQDGVTSARREIHILARHLPMLQSRIDYRHCLVQVFHWHFNQVLHEDFPKLLSHLEVPVLRVEQILNLLLVYLVE